MKVKSVMYWRKDKHIWSTAGIDDGARRRNACVPTAVVVKKKLTDERTNQKGSVVVLMSTLATKNLFSRSAKLSTLKFNLLPPNVL